MAFAMDDVSLEEALDEFDESYLECYRQLTLKLASLALAQPLRLSSPMLAPKDDNKSKLVTPRSSRLLLVEFNLDDLAPAEPLGPCLEAQFDADFARLYAGAVPQRSKSLSADDGHLKELLSTLDFTLGDLFEPRAHMRRLLLGLALTPKSQGRRAKERSNPVHVGNPFYRSRLSPVRRKLEKDRCWCPPPAQ